MTSVRVKALVVLVLMMLAFAGAHAWRPTLHLANSKPKVELESMVPKKLEGWTLDNSGPVQLVSPDQQALLNKIYNQTLSRTYVNANGDRVMLSIAYGGDQSDGTRAHRPDVCYPAQGFDVSSREQSQLELNGNILPVLRMVARLGSRIEPVTYWFVVGEKVALSGTQQKLAQLAYSTRGAIPDGMLVRVSTIDPTSARAYAVQADFIRSLYSAVPAVSRAQVFGMAASLVTKNTGDITSGRQ